MKTPFTTTHNKTTYTFNLENSQDINDWSSMAPYSTAVSNFIDGFCLPSFVYPEVYEFFVAQRNCALEEDSMTFDFVPNISLNEIHALCDVLKQVASEKQSFFQKRNS